MTRTRSHLRVLVAAALMLSACGGSSEGTSRATPATTTAGGTGAGTGGAGTQNAGTQNAGTQNAGTQNADHDLLSFSAPAIGGGSVEGAEFRGRPTLLWFWSPW